MTEKELEAMIDEADKKPVDDKPDDKPDVKADDKPADKGDDKADDKPADKADDTPAEKDDNEQPTKKDDEKWQDLHNKIATLETAITSNQAVYQDSLNAMTGQKIGRAHV